MSEPCQLRHNQGRRGPVQAWLCATSKYAEPPHIHVCGIHALRLIGKYAIKAIERGREYPYGNESEGCDDQPPTPTRRDARPSDPQRENET